MRIDTDDTIVGVPILDVRKLLRGVSDSSLWDHEHVNYRLGLEQKQAKELISELERLGYIEREEGHEIPYWKITVKGNSLAMASAARPLKRKTADKCLEDFLVRVEEVRDNPYYLYKVKRVELFGNYLDKGKERINDIDLAVELVPKVDGHEEFKRLKQDRIDEMVQKGKRFSNIIEEYGWPEIEVMKFLKSGKRSISLHSTRDGILSQTERKVIYEDP